jgi:hypothetical protein
MDPTANLREQLELAARSQQIWDECPEDGNWTEDQEIELSHICIRLGELVEALNGWITKGGFYPEQWRRA